MKILRAIVAMLNAISARLAGRFALWLLTTPRRRARPPWEQALAQRGHRWVLPNGAVALSWGQGPTVLLVHGWEGRGTQLGGFVEPLLAQGFRIVAVDGPAHGDTPGNRSNVVHFAQFLKEVGDALGEIYAVIAHSVGGASTTLAMQQGMKIQRAVLIASPSSLPAVAERFAAWLHLPTDAKRHFFIALERAIGMPLADIEVRKIVADFEQPALLLHDPEDREIPFAASEATAKVWPGARLMPLSGVGHRGILKSPVVVAEVVRFISEPAADSVLYLAVM